MLLAFSAFFDAKTLPTLISSRGSRSGGLNRAIIGQCIP
jgi:hypothetical protein